MNLDELLDDIDGHVERVKKDMVTRMDLPAGYTAKVVPDGVLVEGEDPERMEFGTFEKRGHWAINGVLESMGE